jgi:hypothetical protein
MQVNSIQQLVQSSYSKEDVQFLLKDLSPLLLERSIEEREEAIQSERCYSEILPIESLPREEYISLFLKAINQNKEKIGLEIAVLAEQILRKKGNQFVLVSLARAGTPVGILLKRYFRLRGLEIPHYSVSIIRGRGLDLNAIRKILAQHHDKTLQFVDGWTGKGAITKILVKSCALFYQLEKIYIDPDLAVLTDPGHCSTMYGTREDYLLPHACLNSTVSGLISKTVVNHQMIDNCEFHGAKFYQEWLEYDYSNFFIDAISPYLLRDRKEVDCTLEQLKQDELAFVANWQGAHEAKKIAFSHQISNLNLIKPGIGETTRVLLRRVPAKIIIRQPQNENIEHILLLAKEKSVPVEINPNLAYACCGIVAIKK